MVENAQNGREWDLSKDGISLIQIDAVWSVD